MAEKTLERMFIEKLGPVSGKLQLAVVLVSEIVHIRCRPEQDSDKKDQEQKLDDLCMLFKCDSSQPDQIADTLKTLYNAWTYGNSLRQDKHKCVIVGENSIATGKTQAESVADAKAACAKAGMTVSKEEKLADGSVQIHFEPATPEKPHG